MTPWNLLPLFHFDIDDITLKWQKQGGKQERGEKERSMPLLHGKRARKDHSTAKSIQEREQATSDRESETFITSIWALGVN
jgi:hypothetical protein